MHRQCIGASTHCLDQPGLESRSIEGGRAQPAVTLRGKQQRGSPTHTQRARVCWCLVFGVDIEIQARPGRFVVAAKKQAKPAAAAFF